MEINALKFLKTHYLENWTSTVDSPVFSLIPSPVQVLFILHTYFLCLWRGNVLFVFLGGEIKSDAHWVMLGAPYLSGFDIVNRYY